MVVLGLLFGMTLAPSPRAGVQPVEFMDEAFYSILGRDITSSGLEDPPSPRPASGRRLGMPDQIWYHWGEIWLAGGIGRAFAIEPSFARHLVALPLLLLGIVTLVGSIARRGAGVRSRAVFVFGAATGLVLAPIPVPLADNFFSAWATGILFHISEYGIAALLIPLLMLLVLRGRDIPADRAPTILFVAGLTAMILPAHIAMGLLAGAGALVAIAVFARPSCGSRGGVSVPSRAVLRLAASILAMVALTFAWGTATGHRVLGSGSSPLISPFNHVWLGAMGNAVVGSFLLFTIPAAWLLVRKQRHDSRRCCWVSWPSWAAAHSRGGR